MLLLRHFLLGFYEKCSPVGFKGHGKRKRFFCHMFVTAATRTTRNSILDQVMWKRGKVRTMHDLYVGTGTWG